MKMSKYYYNRDYMHCSQDRCPRHKKCWRYWLGKQCKGIASYYMPEPDKDLAECEFFINKEEYKIK